MAHGDGRLVPYHVRDNLVRGSLISEASLFPNTPDRKVFQADWDALLRRDEETGWSVIGWPASGYGWPTEEGAVLWRGLIADERPAATSTGRGEHCRHGHLRTRENTYTKPNGSRVCRKCQQVYLRRHRDKRGVAR